MLKEPILKTITYFDLHNHPLTLVEIKKYLIKAHNNASQIFLSDIQDCLDELVANNQLEHENGFYALCGRAEIFARRRKLYTNFLLKTDRALRYSRVLRFIPFIRGVALSGSVAGGYASEESDIDFLIIVKQNRIWLARLFVSFILQLLGVRRYGKKITNRICLNHYIEENLLLKQDKNLYTAMEYTSLISLFNKSVLDNFLRKQDWLHNYLQHPPVEAGYLARTLNTAKFQTFLEFLCEVLGAEFWEKAACRMQRSRIKDLPNVFVSNQELSFHPESRGQALLAEFKNKVKT